MPASKYKKTKTQTSPFPSANANFFFFSGCLSASRVRIRLKQNSDDYPENVSRDGKPGCQSQIHSGANISNLEKLQANVDIY